MELIGFIIYLVLVVGTTVLTEMTRDKPEEPDPAGLDDFLFRLPPKGEIFLLLGELY